MAREQRTNRIIKRYLVPIGLLLVFAMNQSLAQTQRLGELSVRVIPDSERKDIGIPSDPTLSLLIIKSTLFPLEIESTNDIFEKKEGLAGEYILDATPGSHMFTFIIKGYLPAKQLIHLPKASSVEVSITEKMASRLGQGAISFKTEPQGAKVTVGSIDLGETPLDLDKWQAGLNQFRFELIGDDTYQILDTTIEVIADKKNRYNFKIPRKPALVTLNSNPPGATILIGGNERGHTNTGRSLEIEPGERTIELQMENYFQLDTTVRLEPKQTVTFNFHLKPEPGKLSIETEPRRAKVIINGKEVKGKTPLSGVEVEVGKAKILITKAGYESIEETLTIEPAGIYNKEWELKPSPVSISITTEPDGATFTVKDIKTGKPVQGFLELKTPVYSSLIVTGKYTIIFLKTGYDPLTSEFTAEPAKPLDLKYRLRAIPGSLSIYSIPTPATLRIDEIAAGTTPKDLEGQEPGSIRIQLSYPNYVSLDTVITIKAGVKGRQILLKLQPRKAIVTVRSVPSEVRLTVTDTVARKGVPFPSLTPVKEGPLAPGTYRILFKHNLYIERDTVITVSAGQKTDLSLILKPKPVTVSITTDPAEASITVEGKLIRKEKDASTSRFIMIDMDVGDNLVGLTMDRYEPLDTILNIKPSSGRSYKFKLKPLPGTVVITSEPLGASWEVAKIDKGKTPSGPITLPVGSHKIMVSLPKHRSVTLRLDVKPAQKHRLSVALEPLPGTVEVHSKPSGATVTVAGEQLGITPASIFTLSPGEYLLSLTLDNFQPIDTLVVIDPEGSYKYDFILQSLEGYLDVASTPPGALVSVAGQSMGVTDLRDLRLDAGSYPMSLSLERYRTIDTTVSIEAEQHTPVSFTLVAADNLNWLIFEGEKGASIRIDGRFAGITPMEKQLYPLGQHRIKIKKWGFNAYKRNFTIEPDKVTMIDFTLRAKPKIIGLALSLALPGSGQFYWGQYGRGVTYLAAAALAGYATYQSHSSSITSSDAYRSYAADYEVASKKSEIEGLRANMTESLNAKRESEVIRNSLFGLYASIWLTSTLDISGARPVMLSLLLPGSGQISEGRWLRGSLIFAAVMSTGYLTLQNHLHLLRETASSARLQSKYEAAVFPEDIAATKAALQANLKTKGKYESRRNISGGFLAGIWVINLVEIVF